MAGGSFLKILKLKVAFISCDFVNHQRGGSFMWRNLKWRFVVQALQYRKGVCSCDGSLDGPMVQQGKSLQAVVRSLQI